MRTSNLAEVETVRDKHVLQSERRVIRYKLELPRSKNTFEPSYELYSKKDDEKLVKLYLQEEDEWAFNEIVNRYSCKIYRLALKYTENERNADDIMQEVFLTLVEKLATFGNKSKFSTWLYSLTKNTSLMYLRKNKKYQTDRSLVDDSSDDNESNYVIPAEDWRFIPEQLYEQEKRRESVNAAMEEIPEIYRTVLRLKDMEGHTNCEISNILGMSLSAVKSRVRRARIQMKDKLSEFQAIGVF
jgi:RNA polymerase sigma-70 factor (ECF subfamily)